jgi:hypothetical protein
LRMNGAVPFFRRYNFNLWIFWPSQHIISNYYDPGCS